MSEIARRIWPATWGFVRRFSAQHPLYVVVVVVVTALVVMLKIADLRAQAEWNSPAAVEARAREDAAAEDASKVEMAQMFITTRLRDPDSAQFAGLHIVTRGGQKGVCGFVNARNGFGGMAGAEEFAVVDYKTMMSSEGAATRKLIREFCG